MSAAMSACSTSRRKRWSSCHGSEYESCEVGEESNTGPLTPRPHAMRGVLVLSGSIKVSQRGRVDTRDVIPHRHHRDFQ
jgi:hypothetical protein